MIIHFQEYEEGQVIAANCAFMSCVQSLIEGRAPHVIGVMQIADERGWVIVEDFPSTEQEGSSRFGEWRHLS